MIEKNVNTKNSITNWKLINAAAFKNIETIKQAKLLLNKASVVPYFLKFKNNTKKKANINNDTNKPPLLLFTKLTTSTKLLLD